MGGRVLAMVYLSALSTARINFSDRLSRNSYQRARLLLQHLLAARASKSARNNMEFQ
jgi:hypothetical protein